MARRRILRTPLSYWNKPIALIFLLVVLSIVFFFTRYLMPLALITIPLAVALDIQTWQRMRAYQKLIYDEDRQEIQLRHPFRRTVKLSLSHLRQIRPAGRASILDTGKIPSSSRLPRDWVLETYEGRHMKLFLSKPHKSDLNYLSFFQSLTMEADKQAACLVCEGKGKLRDYSSYLDMHFDGQRCYACHGTGHAQDAERQEAYRQLRMAMRKKDRLRKQIWQLEASIKDLQRHFRTEEKGISKELTEQYRQTEAAYRDQLALKHEHIGFYDSFIRQLHQHLYQLFLTRMLSRKQEELARWHESNVADYAEATVDANRSGEGDDELVYAMARLEMQLEENQSLDIARELKQELEQLREKNQS